MRCRVLFVPSALVLGTTGTSEYQGYGEGAVE